MTPELHYFRCRHDGNILVVTVKGPHPEQCITCRSWLEYLYTVPVETEQHRELYAKGKVWNPHRHDKQPWRCVRCGEEQLTEPRYRVDGRVCPDCYKAEDRPTLLDDEQIQAKRAKRKAFRNIQDELHEAAYQRAEQEHSK